MKKIFIVSACAISLCFTSCATKQAPAADSQLDAPQTSEADEQEDLTSDESADEVSETEASNEEEAAEEFPEPEVLEEPEIITLEPEDEPAPVDEETETEEVEKEEPPVIVEPAPEPEQQPQKENEPETPQNEQPEEAQEQAQSSDSSAADGVIDITEDDSDSTEQYSENEKEIIPSRSVSLKKFEYLDVTYPGTGWIFMGLTDNSKDIAYFGRKLGTKDTKFSLQARNAGTKIAHFYKNDPLSGKYIDDYLEIKVLPENGSNKTHIPAPEYKLPVQKKSVPVKKAEAVPAEETNDTAKETVKETSKAAPAKETVKTAPVKETKTTTAAKSAPTATPEVKEEPVTETSAPVKAPDSSTLLQEAQVLYNEKEYKTALNKINQFLEFAADKRDEGLYLKGQILEAKSEIRDIKGSIEAYTSLTKNYPASQLWDSANKRIIYLKRFYLEVR